MDSNLKEICASLIENAGVAVIYLDLNGKIVFCNQKAESIIGEKPENIIGKNGIEVLFQDANNAMKKDMFKAILDDVSSYKRPRDFKCHILSSDHNLRLVSWNIAPLIDTNKQFQGSVLFGQDITETQESQASVEKIESSLKDILSNINDYALYVINLDGLINYFGMGCERMFGYQKAEIIFKHARILHNVNKGIAELDLILERVRLFGKHEAEIELFTKAGLAIPVRLTINQFLDAQGKLAGYIFMAKDITQTKKLEYQIFQAEKLAALGQLSAGIVHEINNPLFVISGRLEMLKQEALNPELKKKIDFIDLQVNRIRKFVSRILKFARKSTSIFEMININEIIESALPLVNFNLSPTIKIEIEKSLEKNMPKISGDADQLQEVFLNIILNAYQSMPEGGAIKITTLNFQNLYAQIQITDSGVGIPPANLSNIFMPFFSTKAQGTGLGLSICHNIIANHNGSIELESQVGQGTTFTVKLPFA